MTLDIVHEPREAEEPADEPPVLSVRGLRVAYEVGGQQVEIVGGVDLDLAAGETLGVVGESGSGKSTLLLGIARLLPDNSSITDGQVWLDGVDLVTAPADRLREIRGSQLGVLYQDALRALNPVLRVGRQIEEVLKAHDRGKDAREIAVARLAEVGIPDPARRARAYPHQFSGGMRQRAMTAMALALRPAVLLADEPTTALDATIQAQILDLLRELASELGSATIFVSHDLGAVAGVSDRVAVMYAGRIIEMGATDNVYRKPAHPYTVGLLRSVPRIDRSLHRAPFIPGQPPPPEEWGIGCPFAPRCPVATEVCTDVVPPLLDVASNHFSACHHADLAGSAFKVDSTESATNVTVRKASDGSRDPATEPLVSVSGGIRHFADRHGPPVRALDGIDLDIMRGEFLGLVGESGCGKSTLGRILAGLDSVDRGDVSFDGVALRRLAASTKRAFRRRSQMIFQEPRSSLDQRMTVGDQIWEGLRNAGVGRKNRSARVSELLDLVGLPATAAQGYPAQFSGGQAQRIAIARALSVEPDLIIADEAVSSLDVSIQGQVVNLLRDLQRDLGLSVLFISHDLGVVRQVSDRVAVMYLGRIIEMADTETLFDAPRHPYTQALLSAIPVPDPVIERERHRILLTGDVPSPANPPSGCRFHTRCQIGPTILPDRIICIDTEPEIRPVGASLTACHFAEELS